MRLFGYVEDAVERNLELDAEFEPAGNSLSHMKPLL